ncbi:hypothetical protein PBRA_006292 [Plasmodiophora brassicae]|nr:hypothetical protein PBRA_006292 [Plasmodiophora brassicae]
MDGIRLLAPPSVPGFAYLEVAHDDDAFDIGVFLMPAGAAFPYHDHPGMTVFTRVLAGSVRIRNLDWVDGAPAVDANGRLTGRYVVQSDAIRDASLPTTVLTPSSGNVHGITAYAHSAILDVIVPPYDAERCCSYFADAGGMRLVEVDEPHGLDLACYDAMACF